MADSFLIPYVRAVWRMLHARLAHGGRLCLFGAGAHTRWLLGVTEGLPSPPVVCIVDDNPLEATLGGLPVCRPDEIDPGEFDVVLISSDRWEEALTRRAQALWGDTVEIMRLYEDSPLGPYDKRNLCTEAKAAVDMLSADRPVNDRQVVLVCDQPRGREAKIACALRHGGVEVVLLQGRQATVDVSQYFDGVHRFGSVWEALRIACDYAPLAYHVCVNSDYRLAETFIRHRPGVVVVDSYDLIDGMYTESFLQLNPDFADEATRERFCLAQADGLCCRSREIEVLDEMPDFPRRPWVTFLDGCWNNGNSITVDRGRRTIEHIVYVGKIHREGQRPNPFASLGCNLALARAIIGQDLHLHVYPTAEQVGGDFDAGFGEWPMLAESSPYFHLHTPLAADTLVDSLAEYDAALEVLPEWVVPSGVPWSVTTAKLRTCSANKVFDYIDAGLPLIHNMPEGSLIAELIDRHGLGIDVTDWAAETWGERLRTVNLEALRTRVARARERYDVRHQARDLTDFYQRLRACGRQADRITVSPYKEENDADSRCRHRQAIV